MNAAQLLRAVADLVDAGLPAPRGLALTEIMPTVHVRDVDAARWCSVLGVSEEALVTHLEDGRNVHTVAGALPSGQRVDLVWSQYRPLAA